LSQARVVSKEDPRLIVEDITYAGETGDISAHFAKPRADVKLPGVIVISEIWGLDPHIKDVAEHIVRRRVFSDRSRPLVAFWEVLRTMWMRARSLIRNLTGSRQQRILLLQWST
jgi:hypothetical protein